MPTKFSLISLYFLIVGGSMLIFLFKRKSLFQNGYSVLWYYVLLSSTADLVSIACLSKNSSWRCYVAHGLLFGMLFFFQWWYRRLCGRDVSYYISCILGILVLCYSAYQGFTNENFTSIYPLLAVIILLHSLQYFVYLLQSDKIIDIKSTLPFWVSTGNVFFFLGMLPIVFLRDSLGIKQEIQMMVHIGMTGLLYLFYSIGALWSKPT